MSNPRKTVTLPQDSWQVVQAALLAAAGRLSREGEADAAFEILAYVAPVTDEAASSPALTERWGALWEDVMGTDGAAVTG